MTTIPAVTTADQQLARRQCDPVGAVEIAARLGVKRATVDAWRTRPIGFPPPRWTVGGRPAWNWDDIQAWSEAREDRPMLLKGQK